MSAAATAMDHRHQVALLPHDEEAEKRLLVTLLLGDDGAQIDKAVNAGNMYSSRHQKIMAEILERIDDGRPHDLVAIGLALPGVATYLSGLVSEYPVMSEATALEAAARIAELATLRRVAAGSSSILERTFDPRASLKEVAALAAEVAATATVNDWPDPLTLVPEERPAPYPLDALPGLIGDAVNEVTAFVQCPPALAAGSALAAISTVAAGLADVRRDEGLQGPTGVAIICVADSGERKSSADGYFSRPIREWELAVAEQMAPEMQSWQAADTAWKAEKDGVVNAIRYAAQHGEDTAGLYDRLAEHESKQPQKPRVPRLLIGDATTEAMTYRLANAWPVVGILSSEAGVVFGGHAMGRETIMRNLATINTLWDGAPLHIDRRTSDSYTVSAARITLGLAVQPETIQRFLDGSNGLARGIGFLARFLVACPESTQGTRLFRPAPKGWPALSRFHGRLRELLNHPAPMDDAGTLTPSVLDLSPEAREVWICFHDDIERELSNTGELADARDVGSKAADNAARLAALFHVYEHGPHGEIGPEHMEAAARIVAWHVYEARRFLRSMAATTDTQGDAARLDAWLIDRCRQEGVTSMSIRIIRQFGPNRLRKKTVLDTALADLEDANRLRIDKAGKQKIVELNPHLLEVNNGPV